MVERILPQDTEARLAALERLETFIILRLEARAAMPADAMGADTPIGLSELIAILKGTARPL